jgi:hypothetical protein
MANSVNVTIGNHQADSAIVAIRNNNKHAQEPDETRDQATGPRQQQ